MSEPKTIYDKIWESHLVYEDNNDCLLYIDRHLIHEVTSPQAFEGLRMSNRSVRKPSNALAVADHNIPTTDRSKGIGDEESEIQIQTLEDNCKHSLQSQYLMELYHEFFERLESDVQHQ